MKKEQSVSAAHEILASEARIARQRHVRQLLIAIILAVVFCVPASAIIGAGVTALASYWGW